MNDESAYEMVNRLRQIANERALSSGETRTEAQSGLHGENESVNAPPPEADPATLNGSSTASEGIRQPHRDRRLSPSLAFLAGAGSMLVVGLLVLYLFRQVGNPALQLPNSVPFVDSHRQRCADPSRFDLVEVKDRLTASPDSQSWADRAKFAWLADALMLEYEAKPRREPVEFFRTNFFGPTNGTSFFISRYGARRLNELLTIEPSSCSAVFLHEETNAQLVYNMTETIWENQYVVNWNAIRGNQGQTEMWEAAIPYGLQKMQQIKEANGGFEVTSNRYMKAKRTRPDLAWLQYLSTTEIWPPNTTAQTTPGR